MANTKVIHTQSCSCGGEYRISRACGVQVCDTCENHKGLVRCFCGWSKTGKDGRKELEALGEQIDPI